MIKLKDKLEQVSLANDQTRICKTHLLESGLFSYRLVSTKWSKLTKCCLITLNKPPGIRPQSIGLGLVILSIYLTFKSIVGSSVPIL